MKLVERPWKVVHDFEMRERAIFLRRLHIQEGVNLFRDLYQFGYNIIDKKIFEKINLDKVKILSRTHLIFNKVKA